MRREEMIGEIERAQEEAFVRYEIIKKELDFADKQLSEHNKKDRLFTNVFKENYCIIVYNRLCLSENKTFEKESFLKLKLSTNEMYDYDNNDDDFNH